MSPRRHRPAGRAESALRDVVDVRALVLALQLRAFAQLCRTDTTRTLLVDVYAAHLVGCSRGVA